MVPGEASGRENKVMEETRIVGSGSDYSALSNEGELEEESSSSEWLSMSPGSTKRGRESWKGARGGCRDETGSYGAHPCTC